MDQVVMLRPGDRLKPYKGVTAIYHQRAAQGTGILVNKEGLHRVIDLLGIDPKDWTLIVIIGPDTAAKPFWGPLPEEKKYVVQAPVESPLELNSAMVTALLRFKDQSISIAETKKQAFALVSAMSCLTPEVYLNGSGDIQLLSEQEYTAILQELCGMDGFFVAVDNVPADATPTPDNSRS
jgi:hypothetical protein